MSMRNGIRTFMVSAAILVTSTIPGLAADSWNVTGEEKARFDAKVVDILCELTGDCPKSCGEGRRQLGLLTPEDKLILPTKNASAFSGATDDLIDFCGQQVTTDGIFTENHGVRVFAVQFVKPADGEWQRTNRFLDKWAVKNGIDPTSNAKKSWFRNDPRIKALIEKDGFLGLGLEEDQKFLDENY